MRHARSRGSNFLLVLLASVAPLAGADSPAGAPEWMAGAWAGTQDGLEMEELWTPIKGGSMLGIHRDVRGGKTVSFEFLRIEISPEGAIYWASPQGRPATPFRMVESGANRIVFANPQHDFPTRILYWLSEDGLLHARIEGTLKGKPASEEWTWRRAR